MIKSNELNTVAEFTDGRLIDVVHVSMIESWSPGLKGFTITFISGKSLHIRCTENEYKHFKKIWCKGRVSYPVLKTPCN